MKFQLMIINPQENKEFYTEERCHILELLNDSKINQELSIARARVKAGVTTALHTLKGLEIYYILSGTGSAEIEGSSTSVAVGDIVYISPLQTQRITNTGTEDLIFLCICKPRFKTESYKSLD